MGEENEKSLQMNSHLKMNSEDAYKQGGKSINNFFQQLTIFIQNQFCFLSTISKKLKFFFSFDYFKSLKLKARRS